MPHPPRRRLELIPAGGVATSLLHALAGELDERLPTATTVGPPLALDDRWRDAEVRGWRAGALVGALASRREGGGGEVWQLAVVDAALSAPEGGLVFGAAEAGGACAVVGLGALRSDGAGEAVVWQRLVKAAVHEAAHLAGADHCPERHCVMYPSAGVADTDRKGDRPCRECRKTLFPALHEPDA